MVLNLPPKAAPGFELEPLAVVHWRRRRSGFELGILVVLNLPPKAAPGFELEVLAVGN
jgi:hypothetical protein